MSTAWSECARFDLDADAQPSQRYRAFTGDALRSGATLMREMRALLTVPSSPLAEGVSLRTENRFDDSAQAFGSLLGVDWRDILIANISYDLLIGSIGCSTVVLPTADGPVIARNMDFVPVIELARASYVLQYARAGKCAHVHASFPGLIGVVTAFSANGFSIIVNAVSSPEGTNWSGYPVLLFLRKVLEEAPDFKSALKLITEAPLAMSVLVTLVGTQNDERVVIERSPTRHALRWGEAGKPLMTTNHYRLLYPPEASEGGPCPRFSRLCQILTKFDERQPAPSDEALLRMLTDREVIQEITAQHVLIRPRQQSLRLFVPTQLLAS